MFFSPIQVKSRSGTVMQPINVAAQSSVRSIGLADWSTDCGIGRRTSPSRTTMLTRDSPATPALRCGDRRDALPFAVPGLPIRSSSQWRHKNRSPCVANPSALFLDALLLPNMALAYGSKLCPSARENPRSQSSHLAATPLQAEEP